MNTSVETIGQRIKRLREARGWNQSDLAQRLNKSRSYVNQVEAGVFKPGADNLPLVAAAFGISTDDLLTGRVDTLPGDNLARPPSELFRGIWDDARIQVLEQTWPHLSEADRRDWWRRGHQHQANRAQIQEAARLMEAIQAEQDLLPPLPGGPPDATGR